MALRPSMKYAPFSNLVTVSLGPDTIFKVREYLLDSTGGTDSVTFDRPQLVS